VILGRVGELCSTSRWGRHGIVVRSRSVGRKRGRSERRAVPIGDRRVSPYRSRIVGLRAALHAVAPRHGLIVAAKPASPALHGSARLWCEPAACLLNVLVIGFELATAQSGFPCDTDQRSRRPPLHLICPQWTMSGSGHSRSAVFSSRGTQTNGCSHSDEWDSFDEVVVAQLTCCAGVGGSGDQAGPVHVFAMTTKEER
jgi:hypothetical protein